jgi:hypothetical protein
MPKTSTMPRMVLLLTMVGSPASLDAPSSESLGRLLRGGPSSVSQAADPGHRQRGDGGT